MKSQESIFYCQVPSQISRWTCQSRWWWKHPVKYLWSVPAIQPGVTANFQQEWFDLRSRCSRKEARRSWSCNNAIFSSCSSFAGSRLSILSADSATCVLVGSGRPLGFKDTLKFLRVSVKHGDQVRGKKKTKKKNICPAHLRKPIHERTVCCRHDGEMSVVVGGISARVRNPTPTTTTTMVLILFGGEGIW